MPIKYKIITVIIIMLACTSLSISLLIFPLKNKVESLKLQIFDKNSAFNKEQAETQNLLKMNQTLKNTDISKIDAIYLSKNDALYLINSLENLALNNDCELVIDLTEPTDIISYQELDLNLTIKGELNNIMTLITKIEEQDYYVNYETINISAVSAAPENTSDTLETNNQLTANITAKTYWQ
jgi:Tfp pilus assembly protein PilO